MTLQLKKLKPFAQGGNRLCFVHPQNPERCIKVRRPDFTLADRRRKKGFPKNLKPLSRFDDNLEEFQVMQVFEKRYSDPVFAHISRCYGFEETDMGKGLTSELIRDENGRISQTLKKYLWDHGLNDTITAAIRLFAEFWVNNSIPSRDLLLHNIVVQIFAEKIERLVVIDGLGSAGLISDRMMPRYFLHRKARRKVINLHQRIDQLLNQRGQGDFPGYHGLLIHDGQLDTSTEDSELTK
ncbi:MAG: hypothetical protein J7K90_11770 [Desulfuromusa sp.]|nr:hypothetical protein [Desulfuromusa sp.]